MSPPRSSGSITCGDGDRLKERALASKFFTPARHTGSGACVFLLIHNVKTFQARNVRPPISRDDWRPAKS